MRPAVRACPWSWLLAAVLAHGCGFGPRSAVFRDDPLVASKRAVLGKHREGRGVLRLAQAEPVAPLFPAVSYAQLAPLRSLNPPSSLADNAPSVEAPVQATPAVRQKHGPAVLATPALRRSLTTYDHEPDFSRLQGVLARNGATWTLCYADPEREPDAVVALVPDDLAPFLAMRSGDVVVVVGEMLAGPPAATPRYRVAQVWLAERPPAERFWH
jgi:hypothetical protein